jgi:DNA (cytosine-5)-methyltransferase 1
MKILNLYAGIGGNRKLWGEIHDITAVEFNPKVAAKYQELYPNDKVIIADAHEYLLKHYSLFDFIWTSPPCQTHSRANYFINYITESRYPKMELWQEIIFLKTFFKGKFCVENVVSYYEYFIPPTAEIGRHYLWANFVIPKIELPKGEVGTMMKQYAGTNKHAHSKPLEDRNAVNADLGLHILNRALDITTANNRKQGLLF